MSIPLSYSRSRKTASRLMGSALAFAAVLAAAGCASTGSSAGTYHPSAAAGSGASWPGEPGGVHMNVALGERKLYVKNGSSIVQTYSIGVGKPGYETPTGDYSVRRIVWNPPWNPPDAAWAADREPAAPGASDNPMRVVKIYFNEPDYYIHGANEESKGQAISHGCLRMGTADAAALARYLMDNGGAGRSAAWFQNVLKSNETETVVLNSSIPMHVQQ